MKLETIEVNRIKEGYNPRQTFSEMDELSKSIEKDGLHDPVLVRPVENGYAVIDGARRLRSVKRLGWTQVDCFIENVDERKAAHLAFLKNNERRNLNPIEIASHLQKMQDQFGYQIKDLTNLGYGGEKNIYKRISLLKLPPEIQEKIALGLVSPTTGYDLLALQEHPETQKKLAEEISSRVSIGTRKVRKKVKTLVAEMDVPREKPSLPLLVNGEIPGVCFKDARDMSELTDGSVHLVMTSPPYAVGMSYELGVAVDEHLGMMDLVLTECARVLGDGGVLVLNFGDVHNYGSTQGQRPEIFLVGHHYQEMLRRYGILLTDKVVWEKDPNWVNNQQVSYSEKSRHTRWRVLNNSEHIWIFRKDGRREVPLDLEYRSKLPKHEWKEFVNGVWKIKAVRRQNGHPAQFPEELAERIIKMYSYKGDIVLDPFLGSATTIKVARKLGRIGFGYEKNEDYKEIIMQKLGQPTKSVGAALATEFDETFECLEMDWAEISLALENIKMVSPAYGQVWLN